MISKVGNIYCIRCGTENNKQDKKCKKLSFLMNCSFVGMLPGVMELHVSH